MQQPRAVAGRCSRFSAVLVWLALTTMAVPGAVLASSVSRPAGVAVRLGIGTGTQDILSISETRPVSHGFGFGTFQVDLNLGSDWVIATGGRFGGAWFDFRGFFNSPSGNIEDQVWRVHSSLDRLFTVSEKTAVYFGGGILYGESRSWTDTRFYSDEGPRTRFLGGLAHGGLDRQVGTRMALYAELENTLFLARAEDTSAAADYRWLGRSLELNLAIGIRLVVLAR